jgi:hypothetical protein
MISGIISLNQMAKAWKNPYLLAVYLLVTCSSIHSFPLSPVKNLHTAHVVPLKPFSEGPPPQRGGVSLKKRLPSTKLFALLDVPDGFFAVTFFTAGILLQLSKGFGRYRLEERAWEQRLEEGRQLRREAGDPAMTELDYRRQEAAQEWSAYGKPRMDEERRRKQQEAEWARQEEQSGESSRSRRRRVMTKEYDEDEEEEEEERRRQYEMTDDEIRAFELENGIDYDPYYDEPYLEEELPPGKYKVDKRYGDRIYDDGEIFYKDAKSGLYFRQGSKPRNPSLW